LGGLARAEYRADRVFEHVAKTVIDLDDELVASVARELGTSTKKDTVNAALREVLANRRRLARLMRPGAESFGWDRAVAAGLIAVCPITELEFFYSARSARDREDTVASLRAAFGWVPVHDGAYARSWEVQGELTAVGQHRGSGQGMRWYGPDWGALALQASPARGFSSAETPRVTVR
jgi:Arc/MetJ family transcription regulator